MKNESTSFDWEGPSHDGKWQSPSTSEIQEKAVQTAKAAYESLVAIGSDALRLANKRAVMLIRQYPVQTAAGSLAIGFLMGASIFRHRN